jgi:IMP dehydrogenase
MKASEPLFLGRTFDDFLFVPQHSPVDTRAAVDLTMPLAAHLSLSLPIVGANMDTVVGREMAKTLSLEGCLGFLHRNCPIEKQAERARYVKTRHSYVIQDPIRLARDATIRQAREVIRQRNASGILIEERPDSAVLAGILSQRDMPENDQGDSARVCELMTPFERLVTGRPGITMEEAERLMFQHRVEKLPLVDDARRICGLITMRDLQIHKQKPYSVKDPRGRLLVGAAIGARGDYLERAAALIAEEVDCLLMDVAHADSEVVRRALREVKSRFAEVPMICGNVATASGASFLVEEGADAVKVGVGPGLGCRTRLETGCGVPQLQAIREAYRGVDGRAPLIADGGVRHDKDVFLAIACGASTVMLGSLLSGTDESPGIVIEDPATGQKVKMYRGMTSPEAVTEGVTSDQTPEALRTPAEGQSVRLPYVGSVVGILERIRGHLRSAVSYAGEHDLLSAHRKIASDPGSFLVPLSESARRESFAR